MKRIVKPPRSYPTLSDLSKKGEPKTDRQKWFERVVADLYLANGEKPVPFAFTDRAGQNFELDIGALKFAFNRKVLAQPASANEPITTVSPTAEFWLAERPLAERRLAQLDQEDPEEPVLDPFDVSSMADSRVRSRADRVLREGQREFREQLLDLYDNRCAITGCDVPAALEAAHIVGHFGAISDHPRNGILLRSDMHALVDRGKLGFRYENATLRVVLSPDIKESHYSHLTGAEVRAPSDRRMSPSVSYVDKHRKAFCLE